MSEVKTITLENKIEKLENEIKELKTELSIALENFGEIREFLDKLSQLSKNKIELLEDRPKGLLEFDSVSSNSKLDRMIQKCIDSIIRDYRDQYKER
jgi:archaellum component FlaC